MPLNLFKSLLIPLPSSLCPLSKLLHISTKRYSIPHVDCPTQLIGLLPWCDNPGISLFETHRTQTLRISFVMENMNVRPVSSVKLVWHRCVSIVQLIQWKCVSRLTLKAQRSGWMFTTIQRRLQELKMVDKGTTWQDCFPKNFNTSSKSVVEVRQRVISKVYICKCKYKYTKSVVVFR